MAVAALVTDLMFSSRIAAEARAADTPLKIVRSMESLQARLADGIDSLVIVDLGADGVDAIEAITCCRGAARQPRVVAYASHVQAEMISRARQAGAHEVFARSAFVARLPGILVQSAAHDRQSQSATEDMP